MLKKTTQKELTNLKTWSESLFPTAVKFSVEASVSKAYFKLQIRLLVPVVVTTLFLFHYGFSEILGQITLFFFSPQDNTGFSIVYSHKEHIPCEWWCFGWISPLYKSRRMEFAFEYTYHSYIPKEERSVFKENLIYGLIESLLGQ